jgi:hypothetical protein
MLPRQFIPLGTIAEKKFQNKTVPMLVTIIVIVPKIKCLTLVTIIEIDSSNVGKYHSYSFRI